MAVSKFTYLASYDVETTRCLPVVEQIVSHHRAGGIPATFFVVGELLTDAGWAAEFASMVNHDLFDVQNHSFTHLRLRFGADVTPDFIREFEREIRETSDGIARLLNQPVSGFRTPMGFANGLRGEPALLRILWDNGIRFVSSQVVGPHDTVPSLLDEPFYYESEDILRPILEIPSHGWHDNVLKGYNFCPAAWPPPYMPYPDKAPESCEEEFSIWLSWFDLAKHRGMSYFAPIFHPWSVGRFDKGAGTIRLIIDHLNSVDVIAETYGSLHSRFRAGNPV